MSKHLLSAFVLVLSLSLTSCDKESILSLNNIPAEIENYISSHFPGNKIIQAVEDLDGFTKTYDIILDGSIRLEFNRKKEIIEIDGISQLPDSVIPEKIRNYVSINFPTNVITDWEIEGKNQQVGLDNGLDLEFTKNGDFLRIDD